MDPERWRQIADLYHAALAVDSDQRASWLREACGADHALRAEIEELVGFHAEAQSFLETPAMQVLARQEASLPGPFAGFRLSPGAQLGPYEILEPLGAGGMGQVYRARDARLGRIVALKILSASPGGQEEFGRLESEARAISNLNHPNICTLYDIGHHDHIDYLVMEYVSGQTLAERLRQGPIPYADLLDIAIGICEALDCAHREGVIHRDIKPGNIMLTGRGAKLVDFGLARWRQGSDEFRDSDPLPPHLPPTETSVLMGTPQYMAPEQIARGETDARTDIFSLGAVLFEMASQQKAFPGSTPTQAIRAVESGPNPAALPASLRADLSRAILRCLEKLPSGRWQSAGDLAQELHRVRSASRQPVRWKWRIRMAAGAAAALAAAVAVYWGMHQRQAATDEVLYSFATANLDQPDVVSGVALGADGTIYGTTHASGGPGNGSVFQLIPPPAAGGAWNRSELHRFGGGSDGGHPVGPVLISGNGSLYGATEGRNPDKGTAFELTPPAVSGGSWTHKVLHHFTGQDGDGAHPCAGLTAGRNGVLYGTTVGGGVPIEEGRGTVFALIPPEHPSDPWTERILYRFTGENGDGAYPYADLVVGPHGELYGTTFGGQSGIGTAFRLEPPATPSGAWTETVLHRFTGLNGDGASPVAGLTQGTGGALYGTTQWGGSAGNGTVFELKPSAVPGGTWTETVIYRFTSQMGDGAEPMAGLTIDPSGILYGAVIKAGSWGKGAVYKLVPPATPGGAWTETVLHFFTGRDGDGASPHTSPRLALDGQGRLYGTTLSGGIANAGTVFRLTLPRSP